jgi:tetratricopeptide (TPR) repeat protein
MRRLALLALLVAAFLLSGGETRGGSRERCDLDGPLSDFWPKVIRDWSRRIPGNNRGSTQTAIWVSLIYGDLPGEDETPPLERFVRRWSSVQEWNWVRSEIWKRPYSHVSTGAPEKRLGFRQNMILIGTPVSNPFLSQSLKHVGIRIEPGSVSIADRRYSGNDLLLVAIFPSPFHSGKYVLCIVGTSEKTIMGLERVPFGETDYVLFRGRKVVESGAFEKPFCDSWKPAKHPSIFPDHRGWDAEEVGSLRYHFDPARSSRKAVMDLASRESRAMDSVNASLRFPRSRERIEIYLYASPDEKLRETGDGSLVHLDEGAWSIHRVWTPGSAPPAYQIALLLIAKNLGGRGSPSLRLALALAASPDFEGRPLREFGARLALLKEAPELSRHDDRRDPAPGVGLLKALGAASFVRFLMEEGRTAQLKQLYLNSATRSLPVQFRDLLGESLGSAEQRWAMSILPASENALESGSLGSLGVGGNPRVSAEGTDLLRTARGLFLQRKDSEAIPALEEVLSVEPDLAEAHLMLARIAFRNGDADGAVREARRTLELAQGNREWISWAHVTLGRAEAVRDHPTSAAMELQDPSLSLGPESPRLVADVWLENLGLSPNRKAVEDQLRQEARANLQNFDWDSAEEKLKSILATNPDDAEAHFALSEVYLKHQQYWVERAFLSNELHPGTTMLDPGLYQHLADRAEREMEEGMVLSLPEMSEARIRRYAGESGEASMVAELDLYDPTLRKQGDSPDQIHRHFFLARSYFFASRWERARQECRLSLAQDGDNQRIVAWDLIYLGFIDLIQGNRERAGAYFRAARDLRIGGKVGRVVKKGLAISEGSEH